MLDNLTPPVMLRVCEARDVPAVCGLYTHHVRRGLTSFEIEPPP